MSEAGGLPPLDRLVLGYVALTSVVAALRLPGFPAAAWVLGCNALIVLLVLLVAWGRRTRRVGSGLAALYPLFLLGAFYPAIDILNRFGAVSVHDPTVRGWELALFGAELSRTWWQAWPSVFWSTLLHAVYFAYYPIVLGPPIAFALLGRVEDAARSVRWLVTTFLLCYLCFLFFPVAGPYYEFPRPDPAFLDNPAARLVYRTLARGSAYGAAFPSSHVAATIVAVVAAWRASRALGWVLLPIASLLTVGVVYCQMHYAVDALAGLVLGGAIAAGGWRWEAWGTARA